MTSPLDLSSPGGFAPRKRQRPETRRSESVSPKPKATTRPTTPPPIRCPTLYGHIPCGDGQAVNRWTIEDVVNYVSSIDICAEYAQVSQRDFSYRDAVLRGKKSRRRCSCIILRAFDQARRVNFNAQRFFEGAFLEISPLIFFESRFVDLDKIKEAMKIPLTIHSDHIQSAFSLK